MNSELIKYGALGLIAWGIIALVSGKKASASPAVPIQPPISPIPHPAAPKPAGSPNIAAIQARLNALGASPSLVVDGVMGPNTLQAIKNFQASRGITSDGVVGPLTQAALDAGNVSQVPPTDAQSTPSDDSGLNPAYDVYQNPPGDDL